MATTEKKGGPAAPPGIGDNRKPLITPADLTADFSQIWDACNKAIEAGNETPSVIEDDDDLDTCRAAVTGLLAQAKNVESKRVDAKEPYLSAGRVVDSHFSAWGASLLKAKSEVDIKVTRYLNKKAAAEMARRQEEAAKAAALEKRRQAEAAIAAAAAAEAQKKADVAAAAARAIEDDEKRAIADKVACEEQEAAEAAAWIARTSRKAELEAANTSAVALAATEAKPADMARTRVASGGMATLQENWHFEILDLAKIDLEALRMFIPLGDLEKAIRKYIGTHKGTRPLAGVRIFSENSSRMT